MVMVMVMVTAVLYTVDDKQGQELVKIDESQEADKD